MYLRVGGRGRIETNWTSWMTLTFQAHNPVKSHYGPYLGSCWTNCHHILNRVAWVEAFKWIKISWAVWMCDLRKCVTLTTNMQKDAFDHNFEQRCLGWRFWHLDPFFSGEGIRWSHLFWHMTLTFQSHDLCKITFWVISHLLMSKNVTRF